MPTIEQVPQNLLVPFPGGSTPILQQRQKNLKTSQQTPIESPTKPGQKQIKPNNSIINKVQRKNIESRGTYHIHHQSSVASGKQSLKSTNAKNSARKQSSLEP
jgi:hypothetical protein